MSAPDIATTPLAPWAPIEAALRALPFSPAESEPASYEAIIRMATQRLWMVGSLGDAPDTHGEGAGPAATERELQAVTNQASALVKTLRTLHSPALEAMNIRWDANGLNDWSRLMYALVKIADAARSAEVRQTPENPRGPKEKKRTNSIAFNSATFYLRITGKIPTYSNIDSGSKQDSEFVTLLSSIYDACGMSVSAVSQARYGIEALKAHLAEIASWRQLD